MNPNSPTNYKYNDTQSTDFELDHCKVCNAMTNHLDGYCQKHLKVNGYSYGVHETVAFKEGQKDARREIWRWAKNYQRMKCSGCASKTVSHSLWCRFRQDLIKLLEYLDEK